MDIRGDVPSTAGVVRAAVRMAATPAAAARARSFLRSCLRRWRVTQQADVDTDGAVLVVDELVTNALLHARTPFDVEVQLRPHALLVAVADDSPDAPDPRSATVDAENGRGLALVDAVARSWGVLPRLGGKVVWAVLDGPACAGHPTTRAAHVMVRARIPATVRAVP